MIVSYLEFIALLSPAVIAIVAYYIGKLHGYKNGTQEAITAWNKHVSDQVNPLIASYNERIQHLTNLKEEYRNLLLNTLRIHEN